jgi:hypothetical protein
MDYFAKKKRDRNLTVYGYCTYRTQYPVPSSTQSMLADLCTRSALCTSFNPPNCPNHYPPLGSQLDSKAQRLVKVISARHANTGSAVSLPPLSPYCSLILWRPNLPAPPNFRDFRFYASQRDTYSPNTSPSILLVPITLLMKMMKPTR